MEIIDNNIKTPEDSLRPNFEQEVAPKDCAKEELEEKLVIGARVKIDKRTADLIVENEGDVIKIVEGWFELEGDFFEEQVFVPAVWRPDSLSYESIYHIWGGNLENFGDCEILPTWYDPDLRMKRIAEQTLAREVNNTLRWILSTSPFHAEGI